MRGACMRTRVRTRARAIFIGLPGKSCVVAHELSAAGLFTHALSLELEL